jgi:hypothetical protein
MSPTIKGNLLSKLRAHERYGSLCAPILRKNTITSSTGLSLGSKCLPLRASPSPWRLQHAQELAVRVSFAFSNGASRSIRAAGSRLAQVPTRWLAEHSLVSPTSSRPPPVVARIRAMRRLRPIPAMSTHSATSLTLTQTRLAIRRRADGVARRAPPPDRARAKSCSRPEARSMERSSYRV